MRFGYLSDIGETTPSIFSKLNKVVKTKAFITLYNACVSQELKIEPRYAKYGSIKRAFLAKIDDLLKPKFCKATSFCLVSNAIIYAYKTKNYELIGKFSKNPKYKVAKLIKTLFINGKFEINFDANFMFSQFVYDKIANKNFDKDVSFQNNAICISQNGEKLLCVLPCFCDFSLSDVNKVKDEIDSAVFAIKEHGFKQVYVVMPRNSEFRKHIEVRHCECGHSQIKLVPYTISNTKFY
ncbi:hypothetical protein LMG7974_00444 [Campylobacter majalis]|uniref:Uncharacterized protein n=1 Tax=Campylobacter majalis TaxID=2790656 RepID=A0ABM8Q496_9BACT|nr:hypothetical protein [Campylobacter majalis]CAD7287565.1 hypothetical protein LMG7974_00444 [Campylobacter majalis]